MNQNQIRLFLRYPVLVIFLFSFCSWTCLTYLSFTFFLYSLYELSPRWCKNVICLLENMRGLVIFKVKIFSLHFCYMTKYNVLVSRFCKWFYSNQPPTNRLFKINFVVVFCIHILGLNLFLLFLPTAILLLWIILYTYTICFWHFVPL